MSNIFINDPLLASDVTGGNGYEQRLAEIDRNRQLLEKQRQQYVQAMQQVQQTATVAEPPIGKSPVWDEIERLTTEMTDREFELVTKDEEFIDSQNAVMQILQREYMRIMRPVVESTKDGKEALDAHLALIKRKRKQAAKSVEQNMELFNEYTEKYPDMTFADFLKMKRKKK